MSSGRDQTKSFNNKFRNSEKTIVTAGTSVTYHLRDTGVDDATNVYMGLGRSAYTVQIIPSDIIQMTSYVEGTVSPDPVTITTNGFIDKNVEASSLTLKTTANNTNIKVIIK